MRRSGLAAVIASGGLVAAVATSTLAASSTWRLNRSPGTIDQGESSTVAVEISNLGGPDGDDDLGCVKIQIPSAFDVDDATVTDEPAGTNWSADLSGNTVVTIQASNGGDRLDPDSPNVSVTVDIDLVGQTSGHHDWVGNAYVSQDCDESFDDPLTVSVTVKGKATPAPTPPPTPAPTPPPTPRPTPTPVPTPSPTPTPVSTVDPTAVPTDDPNTTPTPTSTPTPTPTTDPAATDQPGRPTPTPGPGGGGGIVPAPSSGPSASPGASRQPPSASAELPGTTIRMPGVDPGAFDAPLELEPDLTLAFGSDFQWVVPGLVLTFPGVLIVAIVALQAAGALAWIPVVRRRLGGADDRTAVIGRPRPAPTGPPAPRPRRLPRHGA